MAWDYTGHNSTPASIWKYTKISCPSFFRIREISLEGLLLYPKGMIFLVRLLSFIMWHKTTIKSVLFMYILREETCAPEHGFNVQNLHRKCKKCDPDSEICCCKHVLELQPDFQDQLAWSLVQEVIEEAGHLCIFLPKFHYVLLGCSEMVSPWTLWLHIWYVERKHAKSIDLSSIGNHMMVGTLHAWMDAYWCMETRNAKKHVRTFSSKVYKSHRCIAAQFDQIFPYL